LNSEVVFFGVEARRSLADRILSAQLAFLLVLSARSGPQGHQPLMTEPEQLLERIGAA
jgi:hypothetical protein